MDDDELVILEMAQQGKPNQEIAKAQGIARKTLRNRLIRIYRKLDVHSQLAAVRRAVELGLIEPVELTRS